MSGSTFQIIGLALDVVGFGFIASEYFRALSDMLDDQVRRGLAARTAHSELKQGPAGKRALEIPSEGDGAVVWLTSDQTSEADMAEVHASNEAALERILSKRVSSRGGLFILGLALITIGFCFQALGVYIVG